MRTSVWCIPNGPQEQEHCHGLLARLQSFQRCHWLTADVLCCFHLCPPPRGALCAGYCPNALPNCPCLNDRPDFVMPNWTEYFTTQWKPPLLQPPPLQAKLPGRNATDFQKLLPINDIIQE